MVCDTTTPSRKDPNDTSDDTGNRYIGELSYNRKVCRYAKKHHITEEEAIKRLYRP